MKLNYETYKDKVKACWIGKNIGGTMGTPYEGKRELLDVKGFVTEPGKPLPNDDLDLQLVWLHALESLGPHNINASNLGEMWLSFISAHWNEYGIGKANMQRGLIPPLSGDYQNDWRNSNGAWIRTEIWACTAPAIPEMAVKFAIEDAKVDHGSGEGTYAAAFVAAMQCTAFAVSDIYKCIEAGLLAIPSNSRVALSVKKVLEYYKDGKSWQEARNAVLEMNADIGNGWFEAPSNVAYTVLGLVYGEGDFKKSMITAINCGDDTDCTAATVGATLGILGGMNAIPSDWANHIGDEIITISFTVASLLRYRSPKTCAELTERVVALAPAMMCAHNVSFVRYNKPWAQTAFGDESENSDNFADIKRRIQNSITPKLGKLKENTMHFESGCLKADVSLSTVDVAPSSEVKVEVNLSSNFIYDIKQYPVSMRWILPEGFGVKGVSNAMIKSPWEAEKHGNGQVALEYTITTPENVTGSYRCILEITSHGRHTAMYVSFLLFA